MVDGHVLPGSVDAFLLEYASRSRSELVCKWMQAMVLDSLFVRGYLSIVLDTKIGFATCSLLKGVSSGARHASLENCV